MLKHNLFLILYVILLCSTVIAEEGYILDAESISGKDTGLLQTTADRISMLIPVLFIVITIIAFFIDFGSVGVTIGSALSLVACVGLGLIAINGYVIIAFIVMTGILVYKLGQG